MNNSIELLNKMGMANTKMSEENKKYKTDNYSLSQDLQNLSDENKELYLIKEKYEY